MSPCRSSQHVPPWERWGPPAAPEPGDPSHPSHNCCYKTVLGSPARPKAPLIVSVLDPSTSSPMWLTPEPLRKLPWACGSLFIAHLFPEPGVQAHWDSAGHCWLHMRPSRVPLQEKHNQSTHPKEPEEGFLAPSFAPLHPRNDWTK